MMKKEWFNFVLLIPLLLAGSQAISTQQKTVAVTGRVVDEQKEPVSGAIVTLYYPPCRNCTDHPVPITFSQSEGVFFIDLSTSSLKGLKLFIIEPIPTGFWSPFGDPPFESLSHFEQFRGIPIRPTSRNLFVDLGDVRARIRYRRVTLSLSRVLGAEYQTFLKNPDSLKVDLRDNRGRVAYSGLVPDIAFDAQLSSLNLALTKGNWVLQFTIGDQRRRPGSPPLSIDVQ